MTRRGTRGWFLRRLHSPRPPWLATVASWRHGHAQEPVAALEPARARWVMPSLPAAPLVGLVARSGGPRLAAIEYGTRRYLTPSRLEALERAYQRAARAGRLTVYAADELAVRLLGLHPAEVWGDAWWEPA